MQIFKEQYKEVRHYDYKIYGTIWGILFTCLILLQNMMYPLYSFPIGKVKDGYFMTLLAIPTVVYWILITIFYLIPTFILIVLYIPATVWALIIESTASAINGEFKSEE